MCEKISEFLRSQKSHNSIEKFNYKAKNEQKRLAQKIMFDGEVAFEFEGGIRSSTIGSPIPLLNSPKSLTE